jgi:hypothetical protein
MKEALVILFLFGAEAVFGQQKCSDIFQSDPISVTFETTIKSDNSKIALFQERRQAIDYTELVNNLKEGDTIVFSDQAEFVLGKFLGEGQLTKVFDIGNGKAIRIAKEGYVGYLNSSRVLYKGLSRLGVPTIKMFIDKKQAAANELEYLVVEKISGITLRDLFDNPTKISEDEQDRARKALVVFAQKTAHIFYIRDLKTDSLVWDGQSWRVWDALPIINFVRKTKISSGKEIFIASAIHSVDESWTTSKMNYPFYQKQANYLKAPPLLFVSMFPAYSHDRLFSNRRGVDRDLLSGLLDHAGFLTIETLENILKVTEQARKNPQLSFRL